MKENLMGKYVYLLIYASLITLHIISADFIMDSYTNFLAIPIVTLSSLVIMYYTFKLWSLGEEKANN